MARMFRFIAFAAITTLFAGLAMAQTASIVGNVQDEQGKPVKDAVILIERQDVKGNYKTKSNKKGEFFHGGLPFGSYVVKLQINGEILDQLGPVRTTMGAPLQVRFDLGVINKRNAAIAAGQMSQGLTQGMSEEQKKALEEEMAKRAEAVKKNKELNDAFNAGTEALNAQNYEAAIEAFTKASTFDSKQFAVWASLAESYTGLGSKKTGAEQTAAYNSAIEDFTKAIELKPDDAAVHNNFGIVYAKAGKVDLAVDELKKAATLDPTQAAKYYYNLGAVLTNINQLDGALEAFRLAVAANPSDPKAQYQLGIALLGKATTKPDGSIQPPEGTREAFSKYLELAPTGEFADSAKQMLATIGEKVDTSFKKK